MKKIIAYLAVFFTASFTILGAQEHDCCEGIIEIKGEEFIEKEGNVYIKFSITVKNKDIDPKASILLTPEILGFNNKKALPSVLINGKTRKKLNDRWLTVSGEANRQAYEKPKIEYTAITKKDEAKLDYEFVVPYEKWMSSSNLTINQKVIGCAQNTKLSNCKLYADLLLHSEGQYAPNFSLSYTSPEKERVKKRDFQGKAYIDFPVGSTVILADFRSNPTEIAKINEDINKIKNNADLELISLQITGYASPEGSYENNERLSLGRTESLKKYLENIFSFSGELLKTNAVAEDWKGFRAAVVENNISYKEEILSIIDSRDTYDKKEQRLRALADGIPYQQILKDIFPSLRRVEYQIDYIVKDYDLEESKLIYGKEAKNLSELELYNLARTYTKGGKDYMYIMTVLIPQNFEKSETAYKNAFAALIENDELERAKKFLDKLSDDNVTNLNNKGIYYLKIGELQKAESLFKEALEKGSKEAENNLYEIEKITQGHRKQ